MSLFVGLLVNLTLMSKTLIVLSRALARLCRQERLLDDLKVEEGEEGELDENGVTISNKKV